MPFVFSCFYDSATGSSGFFLADYYIVHFDVFLKHKCLCVCVLIVDFNEIPNIGFLE